MHVILTNACDRFLIISLLFQTNDLFDTYKCLYQISYTMYQDLYTILYNVYTYVIINTTSVLARVIGAFR